MTPCFLVTAADRARVKLRRYVHEWDSAANQPMAWTRCPGGGSHDADGASLGDFPQPLDPVQRVWHDPVGVPQVDHADPRWPVKCAKCDYRFTERDSWQVFSDHIYIDANGGEHSLHDNTPGMMWFAPWYYDPTDPEDVEQKAVRSQKTHSLLSQHYWNDWSHIRAPLVVYVPNGDQWCVDAQSSNNAGAGWKVTGAPPMLTCTPSIQTLGYHGWLGCNGAPPGFFTGPL
jgi:hypothetical protein